MSTPDAMSEKGDCRKGSQSNSMSCWGCTLTKSSGDGRQAFQKCMMTGGTTHCFCRTVSGHTLVKYQSRQDCDKVRNLLAEMDRQGLLFLDIPQFDEPQSTTQSERAINRIASQQMVGEDQALVEDFKLELLDPRKTHTDEHHGQHSLIQCVGEILELFPFIQETAEEWIKPLGVDLKKTQDTNHDRILSSTTLENNIFEELLPPKTDTDFLISIYLDHFEQLHRIVHVSTFKKDYSTFWVASEKRSPGMTALILSMISISICTSNYGASASISSKYRSMPVEWISACDSWLGLPSSKNRNLGFHQVSCLVYLAKRMNSIRKRRFWEETRSLVQNAISDGLHHESPSDDSFYIKEMKSRIWTTIRELDLQYALEYGMPSILHNHLLDVTSPANLDDGQFDENSAVPPTPKSLNTFTNMSYQYHSSHSWALRLEISRQLQSHNSSEGIDYEEILRYTRELTQALESLPPWNTDTTESENNHKSRVSTYSLLYFQLADCILAIHRPYLHREDSRFSPSKKVCNQLSRDMLLMHIKLAEQGLQSLMLLREDLLIASLTLTRIIILQPQDSSKPILTNAEISLTLLERCLPLLEQRYLHSPNAEPWSPITMCAAIMLLKVHLGRESWESAKYSCAQRFLDLHYRHIDRQQTKLSDEQDMEDEIDVGQLESVESMPELADVEFSEIGRIDPKRLEVELNNLWDKYALGLPIQYYQAV